MGKTPLLLIAFGIISVLLTAMAAWLAMHRPDIEKLNVETRSRLEADYSADALARRLEPLNPDIVRAAANDEASLTREQPAETPPRRVEPADVTPVATAAPTSTPRPSPTPPGTGTPPAGKTGTPNPGATANPGTPRPGDTPSPSKTPDAKATPAPSPTRPIATADLPTVIPTIGITVTIVPTLFPTWTPMPPTSTPVPPTSTPTPQPPTATPTSIIGSILNALNCTIATSGPGTASTSITFINQSGETVRIYELPIILGPMTLRATLADGEQTTINTLSGRAFKVIDLSDSCIAVYRANGQPSTAIID